MVLVIMMMISDFSYVNANELVTEAGKELEGIGYREQELQLAKGTNFESELPRGVQAASFAGGTHIFIKGVGFHTAPEKNIIRLYSEELKKSFIAPPLTEEDQFNSHPQLGAIAYRIPSIGDLFQGVPGSAFDHYQVMTFTVSIISKAPTVLSAGDVLLDSTGD